MRAVGEKQNYETGDRQKITAMHAVNERRANGRQITYKDRKTPAVAERIDAAIPSFHQKAATDEA